MATTYYTYPVCSKCNEIYSWNFVGFGPQAVHCKGCSALIDTGASSWGSLGKWGKIRIILREILSPTFISHSILGAFMANIFFYCVVTVILLVPVMVLVPEKDQGTLSVIYCILVSLVYPGILFLRLIKRIKASTLYSRTGEAPVWKWWST